ncbi:MAG: AmmeMemoRadiSam system protein B [Acetobacteraceae bacterium]|nr:AmmeMemoRadiSam system protein B [Acetobacteraceae bacterium]
MWAGDRAAARPQRRLGDFALVLLLVGQADPLEVATILHRLRGGSETLIVLSSDLSHFHDQQTASGEEAAGPCDRVVGCGAWSFEGAAG